MDSKRIIAAAVLIPFITLYILLAPPLLFLILILIVGIVSLSEYGNIAFKDKKKEGSFFSYALNTATIALVYSTESVSFAAFIAFLILAFNYILKNKKHADLVQGFLKEFLGIFYCAVLPSYILLVRLMGGKEYLLLLIAAVCAVDIFAYYTGTLFGKKKLLPRISPKKTYEGAAGGLIGATVIVIAAKYLYFNNFSFSEALVLGIILSVSAQIGDLFESLIKRAGGLKDSGSIIPGHGGLLDRIDSLLFAAPVFFYFTLFLNL